MTNLSGDSTMSELLQAFPGAQRALFAKYHIGGCQSCGFSPNETIAQVCARNDDVPVAEVIEHVHDSLLHAGHHVNMHEVAAPAQNALGVGTEGVAVS